MTIQYVGGQTVTVAGGTTAQTITFALTGGLASVPRTGDLVVVSYGISSTVNKTYGVQTAGYTEVAELYVSDTYDANLSVSYKYLTTAETTVVVDPTGTAADNGTVVIQVFRYVDPYGPIDVTSTTATGTNGGIVNPAAITPVTAGAWIVAIGSAASNVTHTFTASYLTNFIQASNATGTNRAATAAGYYTAWTSGAYDGAAWTNSAGTINTHSWAAITIALKPQPLWTYREDNFELATTNLAVNNGTRVQGVGASGSSTGSYAYQAAISYTNAATATYEPLDATFLRYRYRFKPNITAFPGTGSADITLFRPRTVAGAAFITQKITAAAGGGLTLKTVNETSTATIGSTVTLTNNRWVQVECLVNKTGGVMQVWVDGDLVTNVSSQSVPAGGMDILDIMAYATGTAGATGNIYYDDFEVATSAAAWPTQRKVFPQLIGTVATGEVVTASTTHTITMPSGITAGEMIVVFWHGSINYNSTISGAGWQVVNQTNYAGCFMLLWKIATGTDSLTITSSFAMQSSHMSFRVKNGKYMMMDWRTFGSGVTNQSMGSNDPDIGKDNLLYGQVLALTGQVVASAPPTDHDLIATYTAANSTGKSLSLALHQNCADGDNPTTGWTHGTSTDSGVIQGFSISALDPTEVDHPLAMQQCFTANSTAVTSHTPVIPPNTQAGDVILVSTSFSGAVTVSGPGGAWRTIVNQSNLTVTGHLYWKIATGANESLTLTTSAAASRRTVVSVLRNVGRVNNTPIVTGNTANYTVPLIDLTTFWNKPGQGRNMRFLSAMYLASYDLSHSYFSRRYFTVQYGAPNNAAVDWIRTEFIAEQYKMTTLQYIGYGGTSWGGQTTNITESFSAFVPEIAGDTILPGDLVVACMSVSSITGFQPTVVSSGWTTFSRVQLGNLYDVGFVLAYKIMGNTPDTSIVFSGTGNATNAGDVNYKVFRGADPTTPITVPQFLGGRAAEPMKTVPPGNFPSNAIGITIMNRASGATPDALLRSAGSGSLLWGSVADTYSIATSYYHDHGLQDPYYTNTRWTGNDTGADTSWLGVSFVIKPAYRPTTNKWDFESGGYLGLYEWSSSNSAIVTGVGQVGTYAARRNFVSSSGLRFTELLNERTLYVQYRFKISLTAFAAEDIHTMVFPDTTGGRAVFHAVNVTTGGALALWTGFLYGTGVVHSTAITNDTWYTVAMKVVLSETAGSIETRLNGTTVGTWSGQTSGYTVQYINALFGKCYLNDGSSAASTGFVYFDDVEYSLTDWPAFVAPTGRPKVWTGSAWAQKPLKVWNGSTWTEKPVKIWNGSSWVTVT